MRLHDIRHLIGLVGINSGYSLELIGAVLGQTSTATTRRYSNMKSDNVKQVLSHMFDRFVCKIENHAKIAKSADDMGVLHHFA